MIVFLETALFLCFCIYQIGAFVFSGSLLENAKESSQFTQFVVPVKQFFIVPTFFASLTQPVISCCPFHNQWHFFVDASSLHHAIEKTHASFRQRLAGSYTEVRGLFFNAKAVNTQTTVQYLLRSALKGQSNIIE